MPLQKLPVVDLDNVNHRRGARERINAILDHSADDSRAQTDAEKLAGITPVNKAFPPGDIRRYGADPAESDNTAAVQAAVDVGSGQVFIPEFTYACTESVNVDNAGTLIYGVGDSSRLTFAAEKQLNITADDVQLKDFRVSGPDAGALSARETDSVIYAHGASAAAFISGLLIESMTIDNVRADGVLCRYVDNFRIVSNRLSDCGYVGIGLESCADGVVGVNRITRVNKTAGNVNAYGIQATQNSTSEVNNPTCKRIAITGNTIDDIPDWTGIDTHCGEELTITGNICRDVTIGVSLTTGDTVGETRAPNKITVTGNQLRYNNATGAGAGIIVSGFAATPGSPNSYATDIAIASNVITGFGDENDNAGGIIMQASRWVSVTGNVIREPRRHGIVLAQDNLGFTITGNTVIDPNGTAGDSAFVRIVSDYQEGFIGGNSLIRGELSATSVCEVFINRAASTFTNSAIRFDYNFSQHTGTDYYSGADTSAYEWTQQRRSDHLRGTFTATLTGCTTSPTATVRFDVLDGVVTLFLPDLSGTSTTTAMTITGVPNAVAPTTLKRALCRLTDNTASTLGVATIDAIGAGTVTFGVGSGNNVFTGSGTKGIGRCEITYSLD